MVLDIYERGSKMSEYNQPSLKEEPHNLSGSLRVHVDQVSDPDKVFEVLTDTIVMRPGPSFSLRVAQVQELLAAGSTFRLDQASLPKSAAVRFFEPFTEIGRQALEQVQTPLPTTSIEDQLVYILAYSTWPAATRFLHLRRVPYDFQLSNDGFTTQMLENQTAWNNIIPRR